MDEIQADKKMANKSRGAAMSRQELAARQRRVQAKIRHWKEEERRLEAQDTELKRVYGFPVERKQKTNSSEEQPGASGIIVVEAALELEMRHANTDSPLGDHCEQAMASLQQDDTPTCSIQFEGYPFRASFISCTSAHYTDDNESMTSIVTASDLPGPGRALGNLYSRSGRILERAIAIMAHRLGFGPHAVSIRLTALVLEFGSLLYGCLGMPMNGCSTAATMVMTADRALRMRKHLEDDWRRMLRYAEFGTIRTQITAMECIAALLHHTLDCGLLIGGLGAPIEQEYPRRRGKIRGRYT